MGVANFWNEKLFYWSGDVMWNGIQQNIMNTAYMYTYTIFRHIKVQRYIKEGESAAPFKHNNGYIYLCIYLQLEDFSSVLDLRLSRS